MAKIGEFTEKIINTLGLSISPGTPIFFGDTNKTHMKKRHPQAYTKYGKDINKIITNPDYVGVNTKDSSIEFVKDFKINNEYVKVAVRVSTKGTYFARTIYVLNNNRVHNFIKKGTLKKL